MISDPTPSLAEHRDPLDRSVLTEHCGYESLVIGVILNARVCASLCVRSRLHSESIDRSVFPGRQGVGHSKKPTMARAH